MYMVYIYTHIHTLYTCYTCTHTHLLQVMHESAICTVNMYTHTHIYHRMTHELATAPLLPRLAALSSLAHPSETGGDGVAKDGLQHRLQLRFVYGDRPRSDTGGTRPYVCIVREHILLREHGLVIEHSPAIGPVPRRARCRIIGEHILVREHMLVREHILVREHMLVREDILAMEPVPRRDPCGRHIYASYTHIYAYMAYIYGIYTPPARVARSGMTNVFFYFHRPLRVCVAYVLLMCS